MTHPADIPKSALKSALKCAEIQRESPQDSKAAQQLVNDDQSHRPAAAATVAGCAVGRYRPLPSVSTVQYDFNLGEDRPSNAKSLVERLSRPLVESRI